MRLRKMGWRYEKQTNQLFRILMHHSIVIKRGRVTVYRAYDHPLPKQARPTAVNYVALGERFRCVRERELAIEQEARILAELSVEEKCHGLDVCFLFFPITSLTSTLRR